MNEIEHLPYKTPLFATAQACSILGVKRNTLAGQLARYDHQLRIIGIEPGSQGVARSFTLEQIGLFAAVQSAGPLRQSEAVLHALDRVAAHAEQLYSELSTKQTLEPVRFRDGRVENRPSLPLPTDPAHLEGRNLFGDWAYRVEHRTPDAVGWSVADSAGFPLPIIILPVDETLRHAWLRALWTKHGFSLDDGHVEEAA